MTKKHMSDPDVHPKVPEDLANYQPTHSNSTIENHVESKEYCVNRNAQKNGDHEVHEGGCHYLPHVENQIVLGTFSSCVEAIERAKSQFRKVNGCYFCCNPCHTR